MSSTATTWLAARLELRRSRSYLALWWGADALTIAALVLWWPISPVASLLAGALLLFHAILGWQRCRLLAIGLHLPGEPEQPLSIWLADGRRYQARLKRRAGIAGVCCRLDLSGDGLPRVLRQLVIFRDSLDEADWRRLCRYLVAVNRTIR